MERNGVGCHPMGRQFIDRVQVACPTNIQNSVGYFPQYQPQFCHYYNQHVFSYLPDPGRSFIIPGKSNTTKHSTLSSGNDSGFSSQSSSSFSRSSINNKHSDFERCGDVNICVKMNSKKEMLLQVKALKADVKLSSRTKIPKILVELTSKPIAKKFQKKAEVEVLKAVNGMICLDATFKSPIDSILDVNSLTVTIFNTTKYSYTELGFVEIPVASILPNVNTGNEVLLEGWFNIYKLNKYNKYDKYNNSFKPREENKENETINRERRKRKHKLPSIGENYYESVVGEDSMACCFICYSIPRGKSNNFGFSIDADSKPARIKKVDQTGTAFAAGLRVGDEILAVNGEDVRDTTADVVFSKVQQTQPGNLSISINRRILMGNSEVYIEQSIEFSDQQRNKSSNSNLAKSKSESCKMKAVPRRESRQDEAKKTNTTFTVGRENVYDNIPSSSKQIASRKQADTNTISIETWRLRAIKTSLQSLNSLTSEEMMKNYQVLDSDSVIPQAVNYSKWNPDISNIEPSTSSRRTVTPSPPLRREQLFQSFTSRSDLNDARLDLGSMHENMNATIEYEIPKMLLQRDDSTRREEEDETTFLQSTIHSSYDPISSINTIDTTTDNTQHSSIFSESTKNEFHSCLMKVESDFQKYSNHCVDHYINPLAKDILSRQCITGLFQNYEKLLEVSRTQFNRINEIETADDKETYLRRLLFDMENHHRFYKNGCLDSFKLLEQLFDQDDFVSFLEQYNDAAHVKPITSCLLLPLLHVINVAKCVQIFYNDGDILQTIIEFAEECNETIKQVSEFWDGAVKRMRNKQVEDEED